MNKTYIAKTFEMELGQAAQPWGADFISTRFYMYSYDILSWGDSIIGGPQVFFADSWLDILDNLI